MSILHSNLFTENQYWLQSNNQKKLFLYFEVNAEKFEESIKRIPLNISLVIDRSGSMNGDKLEYVKQAVAFVVQNTSKEDFISVVQYDDKIETIIASQNINNKSEILEKIKNIQAGGSTNLSGGMLKGYEEVESTKKEKFVSRVLLLSDGMANVGITSPEKLEEIAQKQFRDNKIALSTFGVGADFNEDLMTNLSEYGGANYYFIEKPDEIPAIFNKELQGLLSVVAQNLKITISFPEQYLAFEKVFGYSVDSIQKNSIEINLNDVFSEEKKAFLIELKVKKEIDKDINIETEINYADVVKTLNIVKEKIVKTIKITDNINTFNENVNHRTLSEIIFFTANQQFENILKEAEKRDFSNVTKLVESLVNYVEMHFKSHAPTEDLQKFYQKIKEYQAKIVTFEDMSSMDYMMSVKMSKSENYMQRKKK